MQKASCRVGTLQVGLLQKGGKKEEMKHLFLAENAEELNNLQSLTEGFAPILNEYFGLFKNEFSGC